MEDFVAQMDTNHEWNEAARSSMNWLNKGSLAVGQKKQKGMPVLGLLDDVCPCVNFCRLRCDCQ